jgi:biotin carboxyl carrier protein
MKIEIKPTGSLYDIAVPLRLSRENEWLKRVALVGSVFSEWEKLNARLFIAKATTGTNFRKKKEETLKAFRQFREKVKQLPDELNLAGRKLKKIFGDYLIALERMHQSDEPIIQQTLQQVKFKVEFREIRERWGNVSYMVFLHYESNNLHPLQFFYYISVSYPEGIFFPSLVLLRTYDFSKYNREFRYNTRHSFNKTIEISGAKNEKEVEKIIFERLPRPAYTVSFKPQMDIKRQGGRRIFGRTKWIVNIKDVSYDVRMPYVSGTISENVLPQLEDLLILLPPYKIVNVANIRCAQFVENVLDLEPQKREKQKRGTPQPSKSQQPPSKTQQPPSKSQQPQEQTNKPQQLPTQSQQPDKPEQDNTVGIQNVRQPEKGTVLKMPIPTQWIVVGIGIGIMGFLLFWMKKRR